MRCSQCGFENASGIRFCGQCRSPLEKPESLKGEPLEARGVNRLFLVTAGAMVFVLLGLGVLGVFLWRNASEVQSEASSQSPIAVSVSGGDLTPTIQVSEVAATSTTTTAVAATSTLRPNATATLKPNPTFDVASDKKTFQPIDPRELNKSPNKYRKQRFSLTGEVLSIHEVSPYDTELQVWANAPTGRSQDRVAVYIQYVGTLPGVYEKSTVVVYGEGGGTFDITNAYGGTITQPLVLAHYIDSGKVTPAPTKVIATATRVAATSAPAPLALTKNTATNLQGKWQIAYVGEFRDKTVYLYDNAKTAFGVWASVQFRVKNLQGGSDYIGRDFDFVAFDGSKLYSESGASSYAQWQYGGYDSEYTELGPGQETVIVATFDVPEATKSLTIVLRQGYGTLLSSPRFAVSNFDQVPAWKPKK